MLGISSIIFNFIIIPFIELLDWKIRYDESENLAIRMMRGLTDRISAILCIFSFILPCFTLSD